MSINRTGGGSRGFCNAGLGGGFKKQIFSPRSFGEDDSHFDEGDWETGRGFLVDLNQSGEGLNHLVIEVNGMPFYRFHCKDGQRFDSLFELLKLTGVKAGHRNDEMADFVLRCPPTESIPSPARRDLGWQWSNLHPWRPQEIRFEVGIVFFKCVETTS